MSDKKHIDRLFQEKFKDFEVKPKANVWANIEREISQSKQKTTLVPLWLRYAGIAALLLLFFAIGSTIYNNSPQNNTIVDTTTKNNKTTTNINEATKNTNLNNTLNVTKSGTTNNTPQLTTEHNTTVATTTQNKVLKTNSNKKTNQLNTANNLNNSRNKIANSTTNNSSVLNRNLNTTVASNSSNTSNSNLSSSNNRNNQDNNYNQSIYQETVSSNPVSSNNNESPENFKLLKNKTLQNNTINNLLEALKSPNAVAENNLEESNIENTIEKQDSTNTIEEAIAKVENLIEKEEETQINRWSVNANIAPVYYNTLGKGSHIDEQFIDNPKNGEVNTSYGVKVGYNVNQKLKVRSGINKLNLSYDTANVIVYNAVSNSPDNSALRNIDFVPDYQGQTFSVLSTDNLNVLQVSNLVNDNLNVALSQRISYYEVPLELEYAVVNKKLGINVIGGASAFFLSENEVVSEIDNQKRKLGEANNINDVSYSANIGLGIDYKFSNMFKFNLEPTFKYQMNAFNETSGNFKPYIIGVYTGFSYKF